MRISIAAAVVFSLALSPQARGVVTKVTTGRADAVGTVQVTVDGTNPCGAVQIDYGDGAVVTHPIQGLPSTVPHEYTRIGEYQIRASGMGNCDGGASTSVRVDRVRPQPRNPPPAPTPEPTPPAIRFREMDENGDGVITRAEWRGSLQAFDEHDWDGDRRLSGDEVRVGAERPQDWTSERFQLLDRNRNNFISRGEWSEEPAEFVRIDRNGDDRVSRDEFLNGDPDARVFGRGRGAGVGPGTAVMRFVDSRDDWTDTGLDVRAGDGLIIDATGTIEFIRQGTATGPDGLAGRRAPAGAPMPRALIGALVGRVGGSAPFLVGARSDGLRAPQDGPLYLRVNDDILDDNRGEFRVSISVSRGRIR
jgi:hypothetical protein